MTRTQNRSILKAVFAVLLSVMVLFAFMPLSAQSAYAASYAKAKSVTKLTKTAPVVKVGTTKTVSAKVVFQKKTSLTKAKKAVTVTTGKNVTKTVTFKPLSSKAYRVNVKVKGKAVGTAKVTVKAKAGTVKARKGVYWTAKVNKTAVTKVTLNSYKPEIGDKLTAKVAPSKATSPKYQWYRVATTGKIAIAAATSKSYVVTKEDVDCQIYCAVTAGGKTVASQFTESVVKPAPVYAAVIELPTGHDAPQVADTLKAKVTITDYLGTVTEQKETVTYKWFADGVEIKNAKADNYTLTKAELGKAITVVATYDKVEYTSEATEKVVADQTPTAIKITGMTVEATKDSLNGTPAVGDTLKAEFAEPEGAKLDEGVTATYQWYRAGAALAGASNAEYKVVENDKTKKLKCKVTLKTSDDKVLSTLEKETNSVCDNMNGVVVTLDKTAPLVDLTGNTKVTATVKKDKTTLNGSDVDVTWYIDSVADANLLYSDKDCKSVVKLAVLPTTDSKKLKSYYVAGGKEVNLVGHKLIAVAVGDNTKYAGTAASAATSEVKQIVTAKDIELNGKITVTDTEKIVVGRTVLVASVSDEDATVTYQWYKEVGVNGNYVAIDGATSAKYAPTVADADAKATVTSYKVVIKGTGNYVVKDATNTDERKISADFATQDEIEDNKTSVTISAKNTTNEDLNTARVVLAQPGDVLKASSDADAANLTYKWTMGTTTGTGDTFTVPTTAAKGDVITLTATGDTNKFNMDGDVTITVQGKVGKATLTETGVTNKVGDNVTVDGVANPAVGSTLTVAAEGAGTYEWYADGAKIENAKTSEYEVTVADLGKTISAKVIGGDGYKGSESTTAVTGKVTTAKATVIVNTGSSFTTPVGNNLKVGDEVKATEVKVQGTSDSAMESVTTLKLTYTWKVGDKVVKSGTDADAASYKITAEDAGEGMSLTVSIPGTDKVATWSYEYQIAAASAK